MDCRRTFGVFTVSLLASGLILWIVSCFVASYLIYTKTLRKKDKDTWTRAMAPDIDPEQIPMYDAGRAWSEENAAYKTDVHIVRDGLHLYGEYYDFGNERCAVILSGRTESLKYGYYFAIPYAKCGCNILVLDQRGHGLSDGEYNTVGFEESQDAVAWLTYMQSAFGVKSFVLHGICIGAATGMFALHHADCPACVEGIVTEGMFPRFLESVKNHMIEKKKPTFFTLWLVNRWMIRYTGYSMKRGPLDIISEIKTPLLMLHSREDLYSTPYYAQKLYDASGATQKKLVWFAHGRHSMLRITDTALYDLFITQFLSEIDGKGADRNECMEEMVF